MGMPSTVERYKHYRDAKRFDEDRKEMEDGGWRISTVTPHRVPNRMLRRVFLRHATRQELDVLYTRDAWYATEGD